MHAYPNTWANANSRHAALLHVFCEFASTVAESRIRTFLFGIHRGCLHGNRVSGPILASNSLDALGRGSAPAL
jgi:hypothetical protein